VSWCSPLLELCKPTPATRQKGDDHAHTKYIVVTHGHDDRHGDVNDIVGRHHARVVMGDADW
jgi:mRNA degradation ribonuclease J1/J2